MSNGFCSGCGAVRMPGARFCTSCGAQHLTVQTWPLPVAAPNAAPVPQSSTPALPVRQLLPLRFLLALDWRRPRVALFLLAAVAPFVLLQAVAADSDLHRAAIGFSIYFGLLWAVALYALVQPGALPWTLLARVAGFTAVAGAPIAIFLEDQLGASTSAVLPSVLTVGLPEEFTKALPVLLFLTLSRRTYSPRAYLFLGALSGLVFGAVESVGYTQLYGELLQDSGGDPSAVVVTLWRLLSDGLFHACMSGVTALFLGLAKERRALGVRLAVLGLALAAVLHGLYDRLADSWGGTVLAVLIVTTFLGYVRAVEEISDLLAPPAVATPAPAPETQAAAAWPLSF